MIRPITQEVSIYRAVNGYMVQSLDEKCEQESHVFLDKEKMLSFVSTRIELVPRQQSSGVADDDLLKM